MRHCNSRRQYILNHRRAMRPWHCLFVSRSLAHSPALSLTHTPPPSYIHTSPSCSFDLSHILSLSHTRSLSPARSFSRALCTSVQARTSNACCFRPSFPASVHREAPDRHLVLNWHPESTTAERLHVWRGLGDLSFWADCNAPGGIDVLLDVFHHLLLLFWIRLEVARGVG